MYRPRNGERIIEKAPSYKEWEDLKSKLQLKETSYDFDTARLEEENTKLKELLKECRKIMCIEKDFASCHFEKDKLCKLLTKINQALGEE